MSRIERYQVAVMLAQEILAENPRHDALLIEQACRDLRGEVAAGRRNQADMEWEARTVQMLRAQGFSIKVAGEQTPPLLRLVIDGKETA